MIIKNITFLFDTPIYQHKTLKKLINFRIGIILYFTFVAQNQPTLCQQPGLPL
jgi:hypothetical protein